MPAMDTLIDDFHDPERAANGARWRFASDTVMGGVSAGVLAHRPVQGLRSLRMTGDVSLQNDGGFISMGLELAPNGQTFDASEFAGIGFDALGNGERYGFHLRTVDATRPWQSWRAEFSATRHWTRVSLPFDAFEPHRTDVPLDPSRLRRLSSDRDRARLPRRPRHFRPAFPHARALRRLTSPKSDRGAGHRT